MRRARDPAAPRAMAALSALLLSAALVLAPLTAYAEGRSTTIHVAATAVAPAGHQLTVTIEAASIDPGAEVHVSGSGYVKPSGVDGSVVTIRVVNPAGVALRPGPGRIPLRNPESGALVDAGLGDWAVVKASPDGTFRTSFRLPNGRDSTPRFDAATVYSLQVITGAAGADDLVSAVGTASETGDTRLIAGRADQPVPAVVAPPLAAPPPPQPAWRAQLASAAALAGAAGICLVLARRRSSTRS